MAFTYSGDPSNSNLENLRFTIGDTDSDDQQFQDAELNHLLTEQGSVKSAAIEAVRRLIAKYSRRVDKTVGDLKLSYSQRVKHYQSLLQQLKTSQAISTGKPVAGGISKSRKRTVEQDDDRVEPAHTRKQFDHPGQTTIEPVEDWDN